ncbi:MAG: hypothetical protein AAF998_12630 [Bacteroidota bacterium]
MKILRTGWFLCFFLPMCLWGQDTDVFDIIGSNTTSYRSYNTASQVIASSESEVIIGWRSARKDVPYNNIYLQKSDLRGALLWEKDGTPLCPYPANQDNFSLVSDGYGGVVVVWEDYRRGGDLPAVYAQRINLRGEPLWGRDGLQICEQAGAQRKPQIVTDYAKGFFVVWEDYRRGQSESDIYAQRLDLGGNVRWRKQGLPIVTAPGIQQNVTVATDENHHLFLMWEDFRNGIYWNLYAQKLDQQGNYFWTAGGLDIFAGVEENHQNPAAVPDGYGGLLFVYQKYSEETHGTDIYRGRLRANGELLFHFATCYSQDEQLNPRIVKKGSKALLCWEDRRYGNWDLYAQMIRLSDGLLEWDINGVPVVKTPENERDPVVITATSYGYQVFSWLRTDGEGTKVFVQKLNNLGEPAWNREGKVVCEYSNQQTEPAILADNQGGLWSSWTDSRNVRSAQVYLQHINGNGLPLLDARGVELIAQHTDFNARLANPTLIAARPGHFFVAWEDHRNGKDDPDIYIQKLSDTGASQWRRGGIPVCMAPGEQNRPILIDDGVGGVIVSWLDRRNGRDDNIFAQRISSDGKLLWRSDGVQVCGAAGEQSSLRAVPDGKEGVVLCWVDARSIIETDFDLYIQRVDHSGEALWEKDGKPFAKYKGLQVSPSLVSDDKGGAYIAWMDSRGEYSNIFVQHINEFGIYEWEYGGRCLVPMPHNQRNPVMVRNFEDDLYLVWQESRFGDGYEKLIMQCITPNGRKLWDRNGILVCNFQGRQARPMIQGDAGGYFWVSWLDERYRASAGVQLYAQRFDIGGTFQCRADGVPIGESMQEWNDYGIAINRNGYLYLTWNQQVASGNRNVFYQKLYDDGNKKYGFAGIRIGGETENQLNPAIAINHDGTVLITWIERGEGKKERMLAKTAK